MHEEGCSIRKFRETDEASCRALVVELQDAGRQIDPRLRLGEEMADEYLREMHRRCARNNGSILVAEVDGSIVGLAMVLARVPFEELDEPPGDYAVVAELVVRHGMRRRGIGAALLREAERFAQEAQATDLRIGVLSDNKPARELYLRHGFRPYAETLVKSVVA